MQAPDGRRFGHSTFSQFSQSRDGTSEITWRLRSSVHTGEDTGVLAAQHAGSLNERTTLAEVAEKERKKDCVSCSSNTGLPTRWGPA